MAFYQDRNKPGKEQKRQRAQMRGGFEDEGSHYSQSKPHRGKQTEGSRAEGYRPEGYRPEGGRPAQGRPQSRPAQGRPAQGPAQGRPQGQRPARSLEDRRSGSDYRFATGTQRYQERGFGTSPRPYGEQRDARQQRSDRPGRPAYDRPASGRPASGRPGSDRPATPRSTFDRPATSQPVSSRPMAPRPAQPVSSRPMAPRPARPVRPVPDRSYEAPPAYDTPFSMDGTDAVPAENLLSGRNPIREALKSGRDIEKLLVARGELSGSAREIVQTAKEKHIPVQEVDRARLDAITPGHQGMLAFASAYQYHTVEDMLALAKDKGQAPFLVLLDGITDPHNLGAIIRTAECAGAHGVIVQERRAVGLTPAAVKASAGAVEYLPVARVTNLVQTIATLQKQNIWVFAADMEGEDYAKVDFGGSLALVIGAEGEGVSRLVLEACDKRVALPIRGQLDSLNASVAAGILLYAAMRAR